MSKPKQTDQARSGEAWITNKKAREFEGHQLRHLIEGIDLSPDSHRKSANIVQNPKLSAKDYMAAKKISLALLPGLESQKEMSEMRHLVNSMKNEDSKNKRLFSSKQNNFIKSSKNSNSSTSQAFDGVSQRVPNEVSIGKHLPSRVKQDPKSGGSLIMANTSLRNVSASNQKYQLAPKESKTDSYRCVTDKTVDWTQGLTRIDTVPKHRLDPPETSTEFQNRVSTKPKHANTFLKETISSIGSTIATGTGLGYMKPTSKGYKPTQGLKECIDNIMVKPHSSTHVDRTPKQGQPFLGLKEFSITNISRQIQNKKGQKSQCVTSVSEKSESSTKFKTMSRIVLEKPGSILSSLQIGSGTHNWQHNLSGIANPTSPNHKSGYSGLGLQSLLDERVRLVPSSAKQGSSNKTAIQQHAKKAHKTSSRSNSLLDGVLDADSCTVIKGLNLEYRGTGGRDNDEVNLEDDLMGEGTLSNQDDVSMGLIQQHQAHEFDDEHLETQTVPTFTGSTAQQLFLHEVMGKGRIGAGGHPGKGTDPMFATTSSNKENESNRQNKLSLPTNNVTQKPGIVDLQRGKRIVSQLIGNNHLLNQQSTPKGALSIFSQAGLGAFNRKQANDAKKLDGSRDKRRELTEDDLSDCHSMTRDRLLAEERSWRHPVEEASHNSQILGKPSQLLLQIGQFKPTLTKIPQSTKTAVSSLLAPLQSQRVLSQTHTKPAKSIIEQKIREATDLNNLSTKKSNLLASALNPGASKTKAKGIMEAIESRTGHSYIPRNLQTKISKAISKTGGDGYQQSAHQVHHSMHQRQLASGHKGPRGQASVSLLDKSVASVKSCNTPIELKQPRTAAVQNTQPLQTSGLLCNESRIDVSHRILQAGELGEAFNQSRHETLARVLQEGLNSLGSQTGNTSLWDIEVLQNLYKAEKDYVLNPHYLEGTRIKPFMRSKLLEWLMQVCDEYAFSRLTFHLAVNYVDRYLAADLEVSTRNLQLVGLVCLVLACKIEQVYVPKLSDFSEMALCNFSVEEIALMELSITQVGWRTLQKKLCWKLHPVTLCIWANWYTCHWDAFITNNPIVSRYSMMPKLVGHSKRVTFKVKEDQSYIR